MYEDHDQVDDDVLSAVKELARLREVTVGQVISDLVRQALAVERPTGEVRNGVPVLADREDAGLVSTEVVDRLLDHV